jgi:hypothetical protein
VSVSGTGGGNLSPDFFDQPELFELRVNEAMDEVRLHSEEIGIPNDVIQRLIGRLRESLQVIRNGSEQDHFKSAFLNVRPVDNDGLRKSSLSCFDVNIVRRDNAIQITIMVCIDRYFVRLF